MSWDEALSAHREFLDDCRALALQVDTAATALERVLNRGGKILLCGNGGSHAHAQHFAAELVVRYRRSRPALAAIALGCNPAIATAAINDLGPDELFLREMHALRGVNDAVIGISTSGKSSNVCRALAAAREAGLLTIGISGAEGMATPVTFCIRVPSLNTARIQEIHTMVIHSICDTLDRVSASNA